MAMTFRTIPCTMLSLLLLAGSGCAKWSAAHGEEFTASLSGSQEMPAVTTKATGEAVVDVAGDGSQLTYTVTLTDGRDITMAHLHLAPPGANGDVIAWLFPQSGEANKGVPTVNGVLATGTITAADLVGPMKGMSISDVVKKIEEGNVYVNVHSTEHPEGDVRGQLHRTPPSPQRSA
jgi:hypothetical protein